MLKYIIPFNSHKSCIRVVYLAGVWTKEFWHQRLEPLYNTASPSHPHSFPLFVLLPGWMRPSLPLREHHWEPPLNVRLTASGLLEGSLGQVYFKYLVTVREHSFLFAYTLTFWESAWVNNYFSRDVEGLDEKKNENVSEGREMVNRKKKIIKQ